MKLSNAIVYISLILLIEFNTKHHVETLEFYPESKHERDLRCPEGQHPECQADEDCASKIADGSLHKNCFRCVCWNVPTCNLKRLIQ